MKFCQYGSKMVSCVFHLREYFCFTFVVKLISIFILREIVRKICKRTSILRKTLVHRSEFPQGVLQPTSSIEPGREGSPSKVSLLQPWKALELRLFLSRKFEWFLKTLRNSQCLQKKLGNLYFLLRLSFCRRKATRDKTLEPKDIKEWMTASKLPWKTAKVEQWWLNQIVHRIGYCL